MIETERLILRAWRDADRAPFHAMGTDPQVMEHLGPLQTRAETDAAVDRQNGTIATLEHGFWAIERRDDGAFLGFCGLKPGPEGTPITARSKSDGGRLCRSGERAMRERRRRPASLGVGSTSTFRPLPPSLRPIMCGARA
jgi:hypothetical protein